MNGQHAFPSPSGMALRLPHLLSLAGVLAVVGLMLYPVQTGFGRAGLVHEGGFSCASAAR